MTLLSTPAISQRITPQKRTQCLTLLKDAVASTEPFFVKVHAAEALIAHQHSEGIETTFSALQLASPDYFVGATRVLARVNQPNPAKYTVAVKQLLDVFLHADAFRPRLVALESLGKLGYANPRPEIVAQARDGKDGMQGMARWVLANSGRAEDEAHLAELLNADDPLSYRYAAYALRFRKTVRPATYGLLEACAARILPTDLQRVYVLSALFVHAPTGKYAQAHRHLLPYAKGSIAERYEVAEALSLRGTSADILLLETLLADADPDVRVATANAFLRLAQDFSSH